MAVTLQELYQKVRKEEEITLVAGEKGMEHVVRWMHMVEGIEISSFLEGDEVVFTTGIALRSEDELLELVKYVYQHKAAGMVINIGPFIKGIPKEVLTFGEDNQFPIFEVPWRVHMAKIMRYFSMCINQDEQKELEFGAALKNAVYFPENEELYLPIFLKYGYKREWSYCVVVIRFFTKASRELNAKEKEKLLRAIRNYFRVKNRNTPVMNLDENIVFFFANVNETQVKQTVSELWSMIRQTFLQEGYMFVGIGRNTKSIRCIGKCFRQAEQVEILNRRKNQRNCLLSYNELGLYKILLSMPETDILKEYYDETLGLLERYDHINETDYLYFLKQFFILDCGVQDLADSMFLHRNSVTYKLKKVEDILHISVNKPEDRTKLMVAFMIHEIL